MYHMMVITLTKKICGRVSTYNAGVGKPNCHNDTVVCMIQDGQAFSQANYTKNTINAPSNDEEAEMWIVRNGKGCPDLAGENLNSIINFKCSKPLKRRTIRQTLQRQREEQERLAQQVTQNKPGVKGNGSAPGRGPVGQGNGFNLLVDHPTSPRGSQTALHGSHRGTDVLPSLPQNCHPLGHHQ